MNTILKRCITLLIVFGMVFAVAGCTQQSSSPAPGTSGGSTTANTAGNATTAAPELPKVENFNPTGFPIVNDPITLNFMVIQGAVHADFDTMVTYQEYEKMSNIHIEWTHVPAANAAEKRNLSLSSGDLPDVYYKMNMPMTDIIRYSGEGMFVALNDYVEKYGPNIKAVFADYPEAERSLTLLDNQFYSLPYLQTIVSQRIGAKIFINNEWLSKTGKAMPTTLDEFYDVLVAMRDVADYNGNGEADEIMFSANLFDGIRGALRGAFGLGNAGDPMGFFDEEPNSPGTVRFWPASDSYRQLMEYCNKLYAAGLIEQEIFTRPGTEFTGRAAQGAYAAFAFINNSIGGKFAGQYQGIPEAFTGPNGDKMWTSLAGEARNIGTFVMTSANKYPEATVRWVDYFYSEEGAKLFFMGIEGETYEWDDAQKKYVYVDKIANNPDGLTFDESVGRVVPWATSDGPALCKFEYFSGAAANAITMDASSKLEPYLIDYRSALLYEQDETENVIALQQQIDPYVNQMTSEFIIGRTSFDQWDTYIATLNQMGLEEYLGLAQTAFDRQFK